ncbi:hypothetical protein CEJ87_13925 [Caldifermentibacillus hisashii]|jgi:hypothetical protein|nr:hypothetical protein CEJ87_13925 [Caldifermentibacillus hisashii]
MLVAFSFVRCKFVEAYSESCGNSTHIRRKHSGSEKAFVAKVIATVTRAEDPAGARKRVMKRTEAVPASATETKINRTYSFSNKILEVVLLGQPQ